MSVSLFEAVAALAAAGAAGLFCNDGLVAAAVLVLLIGLKLVATHDRLYVLSAAYAFHWSQTVLGVLYLGFTGREVPAIFQSDYRPMVLIGLGCCLAIAVGIRLGMSLIADAAPWQERPGFAFSFTLLASAYVIATGFEGTLGAMAMDYPSLRQMIVTLDTARLGILFLILRRLLQPVPRWSLVGLVLAIEIGLGITGFFAGFREPIVLAGLATMEIFDRRNMRHWAALAGVTACTLVLGLAWMAIRVEYRREYVDVDKFQASRSARLERVSTLTSDWLKGDADTIWYTADRLVDRMWTIYYPALALKRVPDTIAHTNGEILQAALVHLVTPRILFPNKPELQSDSEKVRKYSGVWVAGAEQNTSIAFGYAAEAYVDYGVPFMFVPVLCFGFALGACYALFRKWIWHRELFVSFGTVAFWLSLYLFERSWATMLGVSLGFMVYLGVPVVLLDRFLLIRFFKQQRSAAPVMYSQHLA